MASLVLVSPLLGADPVYYGPPGLPNAYVPAGAGIGLTAGGNVSTSVSAPTGSDGSVRLVQSSIGFMCATPQGSPAAFESAIQAARSDTFSGARYRYQTLPDGSFTSVPPTEKTNGVFNISGAVAETFNEDLLLKAADTFRVAIRMNPLSPEGYQGLIRTCEERLIASMVTANQHYVDSVRFRLLPGSQGVPLAAPGTDNSALARQRSELVNARLDLFKALTIFSGVARDSIEGLYLQPEAPFGLWAGSAEQLSPLHAEVSRFFESSVRALALALEVEEQIQRLDYFQHYGNPLTGTGSPSSGPGSAAEVKTRAGVYEDFIVLAGSFSHVQSFRWAPLSRARTGLEKLHSLAGEIEGSRLSFAPGIRQGSSSTEFVQTSFGPFYIPFITSGVAGINSNRSFENLLALAGSSQSGALLDALTAEAAAKTAAEEVISTEQALKDRTAETLIRYNGQLIELCGSYTHPETGKPTPDLPGYMFPPDLRVQYTGRPGSGAVLAQYLRIDAARTRYEAAVQDYEDLFSEIEITEQGAAEEAGIVRGTADRLAHIYTSYGEEFSLLDKAAADVQAQSERDVARIQGEAQKRGWLSKLGGIVKSVALPVAGVLVTVATGGTTAPGLLAVLTKTSGFIGVGSQVATGIASEIEGWSNLNKQGKAIIKSADIRAKSIERISEITQQQTRLRAAESADVALVTADGQVRQIENNAKQQIRKLYVKTERLKLNILLAEQDTDLAELELVNLFDKVGYLLEEYQEATRQLVELPLNRPDFRYVRDYRLGIAEDQFRRAQMWLYLTAKSAQYRFMTTGSFSQAGALVETILKCRNATELNDSVVISAGGLKDMGPLFYLSNGFTSEGQTKNVVYSLRDQAFQENTVNRNLPEGQSDSAASFLPVAGAAGQSKEAASDASWLELLTQSTAGLESSAPVLKLRFATSFDPRGNNPFYTELADQFGHVILSTLNGGVNRKGIFVNIKGRSLTPRSYSVKLEQSGVTYLPFKPRNDSSWQNLGFPVRIWNLPPRSGSLTAVLNKDDNPGTAGSAFYDQSVPVFSQFDERSPYADQWELTIDGSIFGSPNWRLLSEDLSKITDIRLGLTVQGFDPQKVQ